MKRIAWFIAGVLVSMAVWGAILMGILIIISFFGFMGTK